MNQLVAQNTKANKIVTTHSFLFYWLGVRRA